MQRGNNGKGKKTAEAEDVIQGARILTMVAKGRTIVAASRELGISEKHARDLYHRELSSVMETNNGLRQQLVSQDLETLRLLIEAHMEPALGAWVEEPSARGRRVYSAPPDPQAAKIILQALDRRSKLLGLDSAIKVEVSNARVSDVVDGVVQLMDSGWDEEDDEQKALPSAHEEAPVREAG